MKAGRKGANKSKDTQDRSTKYKTNSTMVDLNKIY